MKFTKMQGAGNDFIIINNINEHIPNERFPILAARLCSRRLSIGADGLMLVEKAINGGDYRMLFYNSDGSIGEMCGNGARCIARYGYEKGLSGEIQRIETPSGMVIGERISRREYRVRLNDPSVFVPAMTVTAAGQTFDCGYVELGVPGLPHAVFSFPSLGSVSEDELCRLGRELRYCPSFPRGANISFVRQDGGNELTAVTYERGVEGFTLACGTGCGSMVSVYAARGLISGRNTLIHMPGGDLRVSVSLSPDCGNVHDIFLTGSANIVAEGEVLDEEL